MAGAAGATAEAPLAAAGRRHRRRSRPGGSSRRHRATRAPSWCSASTSRPPSAAWPASTAWSRAGVAGEPLQYVLGRWAFRTLDLFVDRAGADPPTRDRGRGRPRPRRAGPSAGDAGRRAAAVAGGRPRHRVRAPSPCRSPPSARASTCGPPTARPTPSPWPGPTWPASGRRARRCTLAEGSWFDALDPALRRHASTSSSPTRPTSRPTRSCPPRSPSGSPTGALVAGPTGLEDLEVLVDAAPGWLAPTGCLVLELAPHQAEAVAARARARGFADVEVRRRPRRSRAGRAGPTARAEPAGSAGGRAVGSDQLKASVPIMRSNGSAFS